MSKKIETPAPVGAPERSAARTILATRISSRDAARAVVEGKQSALRRLQVIGETSQAIAAQLRAAKARDAQRLADHVLRPEGKPPVLADEERTHLHARLAEAEARAEAAVPALALVEQEVAQAHAAHHQAGVAVHGVVIPVLEEELQILERELQALNRKVLPLQGLIAGLRSWALAAGAGKEGDARTPFLSIMNSASEAMRSAMIPQQAPTNGSEAAWQALMDRLLSDADAPIRSDAAVA